MIHQMYTYDGIIVADSFFGKARCTCNYARKVSPVYYSDVQIAGW